MFTTRPTEDFPGTAEDVREQWRRMKAEPVELERPVLVLDGWRMPAFSSGWLAGTLRRLTGGEREEYLGVSYPLKWSMDAAVAGAVRRVEDRWPSEDPDWTVEVDVVGYSMGGIVARAAAAEPREDEDRKRLRIRTLYTIGTPHRGARMARYFALDGSARSMRPGSQLLARLDEDLEAGVYEIVPYTQTNDWIVGATNTAPEGMEPIWTPGTWLFSHTLCRFNRRILADIALRLRGEEALAVSGSAPPGD